MPGVDAEARERAARPQAAQRVLEGPLGAEGLDGHVGAAAGQSLDLGHDIDLGEVERDVGAHALGHREPDRVAVDADDERCAHQLGAGRRAQADRALGEDDDRVADPDAARFGSAEAGRGDVGQQHDLLVGHAIGDLCQVGLGRRDEDVLGLRPVDGVAEAPAAHGLVALAVAALAEVAGQAGAALAARRDAPTRTRWPTS